MDFSFNSLLKKNERRNAEAKPAHIVNVAAGTTKRRENQLKARKSTRLTIFDKIRDLAQTPNKKVQKAQTREHQDKSKLEHRRKQLEKWKEEKERKKNEEAAHKKKPFLAGVSTYVKPVIKPVNSNTTTGTGRVTRSQANAANSKNNKQNLATTVKSFAPHNAEFQPPVLKTASKYMLQPVSKAKTNFNITFDPILPSKTKTKPTTSKNVPPQMVTERKDQIKKNIRPNTTASRQNSVTNPIAKVSTANKQQIKKTKNTVAIDTQPSCSGTAAHRSTSTAIAKRFVQNKKNTLHAKSSSTDTEPPLTRCLRSTKLVTVKETNKQDTPKCKKRVQTPRHITEKKPVSIDSFENAEIISSTSRDILNKSNETTFVISPAANTVDLTATQIPPAAAAKISPVHLCTPKEKNIIPKSESSSEEKLRSPKSPVDLTVTPMKSTSCSSGSFCPTPELTEELKISPTITLSRGKSKARDEMKWKLNEGLLDEDTCQMESVEHFRKQLASEIERMAAMCEQWDNISQQTLPEFVQEHILSAVGQARLLMSQKLQQFASLIERCAKPEPGTVLVTPTDLHGFWDMVFMQVENVDIKFKNLEKLRDHNWIEEVPVISKMAPKMAAKPPPRPNPAKKAKPAVTSRIREMMAAARRAKKEQQEQSSPVKILLPATPNKPGVDEKVFDAGFFSVSSPVRTPVPRSDTLLKAVLSSEAKKAQSASVARNSASFAMLRASMMSRGVDCEGIDILPQTPVSTIRTDATPGRSILKSSTKPPRERQSNKKSNKVLFIDQCDSPDKGNVSSSPENREVCQTLTFDDGEPVKEHTESTVNEPKKNSRNPLTKQNAIDLGSPIRTRHAGNNNGDNLIAQKENTPKRLPETEPEDKKNTPVKNRRKSTRNSGIDTEINTVPRSERRSKSKALEEIHNSARKTRSRKSVI